MERQRTLFCVVLLFALIAPATSFAGKLGKIRSAAKGDSRPARSASTTRKESPPTPSTINDDDPSHDVEPAKPSRSAAPRKPAGKLNRIRVAAASHNHQSAPTPQRSRGRSRPQRSIGHRPFERGGISFYSHYSAPVCLPSVVEEHHYYEDAPVVFVEPAYLPASPHVEPQTVVVHDDPFEYISDFHVRFEIDYAADEADVSRSGFGLLVNATGGLGVDTGVRMFRESNDDFRDHLWLGDFNVVYELFPTQFARTRAGIGVNWMADRYGSEAGFNMTLGTDLFAGPVTFTGEVDLGTLGDTDLVHGRLTAAISQGEHLEWFAGYDYLDIGGTEIRGMVGGIRFRF